MASVYRQDTGEFLGYMTEPEGPLARGITDWPFKAWRHPDGSLRSEPGGTNANEDPAATLDIPLRNADSSDVHLIVPPDLVDFIVTHRHFVGP